MKGKSIMNEAIKSFIGKDCVITTLNTTITGVVESIEDNWVSIKPENGGSEIVNIDHVSRIREYPLNKSGKKKLIIS
jgi:hypothetical protein